MPRKRKGERARIWEIKTRPELLHPILEAKHEQMVESIKKHYTSIDEIYGRVAEILDQRGIHTQARLLYRSYAERLYQTVSNFSGKTAKERAQAITTQFYLMGADEQTLKEIASLFGITIVEVLPVKKIPIVLEGVAVGYSAKRVITGLATVWKYILTGEPTYVSVTGLATYTYTITTG